MNKLKFDELLQSIDEMDQIVKGKIQSARQFEFPDPQVKLIRENIGLSQAKFAMLIGVSKRTLDVNPKHAVEALYNQERLS